MKHVTIGQLEALLFMIGKKITYKELSKILDCKVADLKSLILELASYYQSNKRGIRIVTNSNSVELVSAPEHSKLVQKLRDYEQTTISNAKIETLSILAYNGPISKARLEQIRGVNCTIILRNLIIEELIDELDQGREVQYIVSTKFLKGLGLTSIQDLPQYQQYSNNI